MNTETLIYHVGLLYLENKVLQQANAELTQKLKDTETKPKK